MSNPSNHSAERGVLSGICRYGSEIYYDIGDILDVETFTLDSNKIIFKCLKHCIDNEVTNFDINTILAAAKSLDYYDFLTTSRYEREHLKAILNAPIEQENVRKLAAKIKKLQIARGGIDTLNTAEKALYQVTGDETVSAIFATIEDPIFDYVLDQSGDVGDGPKKLGSSIDSFIRQVKENPGQSMGIPTGYKVYDHVTGGGLRPGVSVVSARMKVGKTSLSLNAAFHIAGKLNIPVLIMDTELKAADYHARALANLSGYTITDIELGTFEDEQRVEKASNKYKDIPLYHECVIGKSFEETLSIIRRWFLRTVGLDDNGRVKPCVVIYDFLRITDRGDINANMTEHQLLGFQIMDLNNLVKKYDVPCLCFVQSNRQGIDKEHTGVVGASDRIGWFCTSLSLFKRKTSEEIVNDGPRNGNRKLIVLESRFGPALSEGEYINIYHDGARCRITEIGLAHISDDNASQEDFDNDNDTAF